MVVATLNPAPAASGLAAVSGPPGACTPAMEHAIEERVPFARVLVSVSVAPPEAPSHAALLGGGVAIGLLEFILIFCISSVMNSS